MAKGRYGDGSVFQRSDGMHVVRLELGTDENGKRIRWQATSRTAEGALEKLRRARLEQATTGTIASSVTAGEWMDEWMRMIVTPHLKPRVVEEYQRTVDQWLRPSLGKRQLARVTPAHVRALMATATEKTSAGNAARIHRVLSSCLTAAMRDGLVPRNVARLVKAPSSTSVRGALTADHARTVVRHLDGHPMRSRWLLALLTGARQAECLGLQWDRVDLRDGVLDISAQLQQLPAEHGCLVDGKTTCGRQRVTYCPKVRLKVAPGFDYRPLGDARSRYALILPKSDAGQRIIPMPGLLVDALREHRKGAMINPAGLCWVSPRGLPTSRRVDSAAWDTLLRDAGVPDVPLHSARHTTATLLMDLGVDTTVIQAVMGHATALSTQAYLHADMTMSRRAIDGLGDVLSGT